MSSIPASAMPHAYDHDDRDKSAGRASPSPGLLLGGAAVAVYLLFRLLR